MQKLQEIFVTGFKPFSQTKQWANPYCHAFVYARKGNFLVKGMLNEVEDYISHNLADALVNFTLFKDGQTRGYWKFINAEQKISLKIGSGIVRVTPRLVEENSSNNKGYTVYLRSFSETKELHFKRLPHKWIPEFDLLA